MKKFLAIPFVAVALAACGGGGGGGGAPSDSPTVKLITDKGSITTDANLNGVQVAEARVVNGATEMVIQGRVTIEGLTVTELSLVPEGNRVRITTDQYGDISGNYRLNGDILSVSSHGYTVTLDVEDLQLDEVNGTQGRHDFLITNVGTGDKDFSSPRPSAADYARANNATTSGTWGDQVRRAHDAGWTGKGLSVQSAFHDAAYITAPGAVHSTSTNNDATVCRLGTNDCYTYAAGNADRNAAYAGANAVVSHKFDTITTHQSSDILRGTAHNGTINLDRALSPVGNLR